MKYIMWDIDGTMILSGGAGKQAMINVIKDYYFLDAFDFTSSLAGRTDSDIIKEVVCRIRGCFIPAEAAGLLIRYHMALPKEMPLHAGKVLPNVEKALAYFQRPESGFANCMLTGNTKAAAQIKLHHLGIDHYLDFNRSVFGELSEDRSELAKIAWHRLFLADQSLTPADIIFVGDTPNDVKCANAIGARCLVVLAGSHYTPEDFAQVKPWRIIPVLPEDPRELEQMFLEA